jgi:hypothetical protein
MRYHHLLVVALLLPAALAAAQEMPEEKEIKAEDEKLLQAQKIPVDGPGLVAFFRQQTATEKDVAVIGELCVQLGHKSFPQREKASAALTNLGPKAIPQLRKVLRDGDAEMQRRAGKCIEAIEGRYKTETLTAALRRVRMVRPEAACETVLAYLPAARDRDVEEAALSALWYLGVQDRKLVPALRAALEDKAVSRRAAAALIAGRFGSEEERVRVKKLFADTDPIVRFRAAQGCLAAGDKAALPVLLGLVEGGPLELAQQAEDFLKELAGDKAPALTVGEDKEQRKRCRETWERWLDKQAAEITLSKSSFGLPLDGTGSRAGAVGRRFLDAIVKHDIEGMIKTIDVPFNIDGLISLESVEKFRQLFANAVVNNKQPKVGIVSIKLARFADYTDKIKPETRRVYANVPASELRVLHVESTTEGKREQSVLLIVRLRGAQARVIGLAMLTKQKG